MKMVNSQHRVSPFKLIDPTKPGHRRFIALWLVDPTHRIISTANVPPQQMNWYTDSVFGPDSPARKEVLEKLPPDVIQLLAEAGKLDVPIDREFTLPEELREYVRGYMKEDRSELPMTVEEAEEHRLKLMQERSAFVKNVDERSQSYTYSFCEH